MKGFHWPKIDRKFKQCYIISYTLLESAVRPDIHSQSSRSHEAEPSRIWMTEGG